VCHVDHQVTTDGITNFAEACVVEVAAVCRGTSDNDLGTVHEGIFFETVVIDYTSFEVNAVGKGFKVC
jgi:hypothetical protein